MRDRERGTEIAMELGTREILIRHYKRHIKDTQSEHWICQMISI